MIMRSIIIIFALFALSRVFVRYKDRQLSNYGLFFWSVLWILVLVITFFPGITDETAKIFGIARGTDSAFFFSILIIFYLVFRLYIKIDKMDKDTTEMAINISKLIHKQKKQ